LDKEKNKNFKILIVDDEPLIRDSLFEIMKIDGYKVQTAQNGEDALELLKKSSVDIVVTDLKLPKMSGVELLEGVKKLRPETEVILITGYGSIESAVDAMKKGAFHYVTKPINDQEIKIIISKIVDRMEILTENRELKEIIAKERRSSFCTMIGSSEKMQNVYHIIESVASSNATVLITGESGTGKGLVARAIHASDTNRHDKTFVEVSCGALTETLLESELFGHVKGAFTGAIKDKEGRFEYANGGTIFLDEIDAFSLGLQVKLLKVLQDGIFERVGDNTPRKASARIIVATNRSLPELVTKGTFREDLYYRINVIAINTPPLRERKEDIEALAKHYLIRYSKDNNKKIKGISEEVLKMFKEYHWPGNVRELENAIAGATIMAKTEIVQKWDIPNLNKFKDAPSKSASDEYSLKKIIEMPEKEHIISVLKECNWNRNKAASVLGVNRTTLYNKMKKYRISEHPPR
jgi:two-component system response regulator AtoC